MTYRPPHREIAARIFTPEGWLTGTFHLPRAHSLLDHLNHAVPFVKLVAATLPTGEAHVPFLALRREAAVLIVPQDEGDLQEGRVQGETEEHQTTCLIRGGSITGRIQTLKHVRLSDYLIHHPGFILMHGCRLEAANVSQTAPRVLLNAAQIVAASEVRDTD